MVKTLINPSKPATPVERAAVRFTRASMEHSEPGGLDSIISAAAFNNGPTTLTFDVPAYGYARRIQLLVESDGNGTGAAAVVQPDAPWSFFKSITFKDVNGGNIVGPITGFELFLINKWGGYHFDDNPVNDPNYSAVATDGEFAFRLDIPLEAIARDAIGALPNLNSANAYKVELVIADSGDVYSTLPTTTPGVRIRAVLDAWAKPSATDPRGNPQVTSPPMADTTQFWSKATQSIAGAGENIFKLPRVGNFIRNWIFVFRDAAGEREGTDYAGTVKITVDGQSIHNEPTAVRRAKMAEMYGYSLASIATADFDEGVIVYSYTHDFDGKPGGEMRDLWFPTVQSSRVELTLSNAGEAGTIEAITNDVSVAS